MSSREFSSETARQLRIAAAAALEAGGTDLVARVLHPFTPTGRLTDVPPRARLEAAAALLVAVAELRGGTP